MLCDNLLVNMNLSRQPKGFTTTRTLKCSSQAYSEDQRPISPCITWRGRLKRIRVRRRGRMELNTWTHPLGPLLRVTIRSYSSIRTSQNTRANVTTLWEIDNRLKGVMSPIFSNNLVLRTKKHVCVDGTQINGPVLFKTTLLEQSHCR